MLEKAKLRNVPLAFICLLYLQSSRYQYEMIKEQSDYYKKNYFCQILKELALSGTPVYCGDCSLVVCHVVLEGIKPHYLQNHICTGIGKDQHFYTMQGS